MPLYESKVLTKANRVRTIAIQARSEDEAKSQVKRAGRLISFKRKIHVDLCRGLYPADRQIFFSRRFSMLSSKVGTSEALRLIRDTFSGEIQEVTGRMLTYIETGDDLPVAMEKIGQPDFPQATIAMIKAGSRTGETWRAIKDAANFEYQLSHIKKGASKGLITGIGSFLMAGA